MEWFSEEREWPWTYERTLAVRAAREQRNGALFIDELLQLAGVDGPSVYPPASRNALVQLVDALVPSLQSTAIIFYLLLATHPSLVPVYAQAKLIPTAYVRTVSGLHALDASDWHTAVRDLTHPSVSLQDAGFGSKILFVLGNLPAVDVRAEVVLSYWRLGRVELQGAEEKGVVVDALCDESRRIGAREAWALMRAEEDEAVRETLLERVLARCFGVNARDKPAPHHLITLLSQPFNDDEDRLTSSFVLSSPTLTSELRPLAADWRISKLIAEGRPVLALQFGREVEARGLSRGGEERAKLLRHVRETLTEVQRGCVDLEMEMATFDAGPVASTSYVAPVVVKRGADGPSHVATPVWEPVVPAPVGPLPTSLLSVAKPPPAAPLPTASELPLSASPFLRREKPQVSSTDGSALGGAQKSVLRALREGTSFEGKSRGGPVSPLKLPSLTPLTENFGSPARAGGFARSSVYSAAGSTTNESPRKAPTLAGFGSMRLPGGTPLREREDPMTMREPVAADEEEDDPAQGGSEDESMGDTTFEHRVVQDPAVLATLAAASSPNRIPSTSTPAPKRRTFSTRDRNGKDKKRAVSTETEDRPSAAVRTQGRGTTLSRTQRPPGAFPGQSEAEETEHEEDVASSPPPVVKKPARRAAATKTPAKKASTTRAKALASDAAEATAPVTPRARRASSVQAEGTPRAGVRRSTRLGTPARESTVELEEEEEKLVRKTAKKSRARKVVEEEED